VIAAGFSDTITLGSIIISAVAAAAVIVGVFYGVRYKVSYEAASSAAEELRKSLADEKDRSKEEKEIAAAAIVELQTKHEKIQSSLQDALSSAQQTISRLESLPDMAQLVRLLDQHEVRAQERHEATAAVLPALADRITTTT
jgi:hypothetical protein